MIKKGIVLGCLLTATGCISSELLVDVSGIAANIDALDLYVLAQPSPDAPKMLSQRLSITTDLQKVAAANNGHYTLTLDHQLSLSKPGQVQLLVAGLAKNCFRGYGTAAGELKENNDGYSKLDVALLPKQPNDGNTCTANQPAVTEIEFSRHTHEDGSITNDGLVYGWGFTATSKIHMIVMPSMSNMFVQPVDFTVGVSEYLPDHVRFSMAQLTPAQLGSVLLPGAGGITFMKTAQAINDGSPSAVSNAFAFK